MLMASNGRLWAAAALGTIFTSRIFALAGAQMSGKQKDLGNSGITWPSSAMLIPNHRGVGTRRVQFSLPIGRVGAPGFQLDNFQGARLSGATDMNAVLSYTGRFSQAEREQQQSPPQTPHDLGARWEVTHLFVKKPTFVGRHWAYYSAKGSYFTQI